MLGRLHDLCSGKAFFAPDLAANLEWGDEQALNLLRDVDALIQDQGLDAPMEDPPGDLQPIDELARAAPAELDLAKAGIGTIVWATGYRPDFSWVGLPFLDEEGYPIQQRGVAKIPGLYILGLDWLHSAKSGLFAGVGEDAAYLASVMATEHAARSTPV